MIGVNVPAAALAAGLCGLVCIPVAVAVEPPAKAVQCFQCHGKDGIGLGPDFPNLAGQKATYLVKALRDFRSGKRQDEVMSLMAKPLTDAEITQLAEYYESLGAK